MERPGRTTDRPTDRGAEGDLTRFGPYVVVEKIASGGMAEIFKAHHESTPRAWVALKRIRPDCDEDLEFRKMMLDEAKIASGLAHPNIARVLGVEQDGDQLGLILEYVDGLDLGRLERVLRDRGQHPSLEVSVHIVRQILLGLDFAHNAKDSRGEYLNIVHRDISPGNVMIDVKGRVRIVDFGIARAQNRMAKTEAGNVKGKFRYMAPEQIKGFTVGPYTDVYSTAVVLWELLAGHRIYDEVSVGQLMIRVANADLPPLAEVRSDLPRALLQVFARATALDPADRFASARAFSDALDSVFLQFDQERFRRELEGLVLSARTTDRQRGLQRAVIRARFAAERDTGDLEVALLRALETPDRVERVDIDWERLRKAEPNQTVAPASPGGAEPTARPLSRDPPPDPPSALA